jgi:glucuronate isomerase
MRPFIHDDFLLQTATARWLYHEVASQQPIIDYHSHLSPADLAVDRRFQNLAEAWLEGDHYKWRAMRANGVPERLISGDASPSEKFMAWAATVPMTWRNPLHHWTQLELARHFGIYQLLGPDSAADIWQKCNAALSEPSHSVRGILKMMRVELVCTSDDPTESLDHHAALKSAGVTTRILPTFRPDRGFEIHNPADWNPWVDRLAARSRTSICDFEGLLAALKKRHDDFHEIGCRLSDHGLEVCPFVPATDAVISDLFHRARAGATISATEAEQFRTRVLLEIGRWNFERGWALQLHIGALRNTCTRKMRIVGRDSGGDSIGDRRHSQSLARFLDELDREDKLPRTILYNVNPSDNYVFATMTGNFNDGSIPAKIQFGPSWWHMDQKEGIEWHLNALSHLSLLSRFVGMVADSRSFLSFPRHEYFRRVLCNLLGSDVEAGMLPNDRDQLRDYVERVTYRNALEYFGF